MVLQRRIEDKLRLRLAPDALVVENESSKHNVPRGSETHFKVTVVSQAFEGMGRVDRHRLVHDALAEELKGGVHALTITPRTPNEWAADSRVGASPPCLGGEKGN
jgi:stress-induced morphogen